MAQSDSDPTQNIFNISGSSITNIVGSGTIHHTEANQNTPPLESDKQVILFLAAQPFTTARLRLDEEIREIEAGLRRSKYRDRFQLEQQWAVRPRDLQRAMLDHNPQIVHFAGHGIGRSTTESTRKFSPIDQPMSEGLILEDETGQPKLISTEALAAWFKLFSKTVECVVLNACYSEVQANAIAQHIPYVIGMQSAIGDRAAIEFSIGFYDALGAGESIQRAYDFGVLSIRMAGIPEHLIPRLLA